MLIEIKGVQFVNKGAALMLQAIRDRLQQALPSAEIALTPGQNSPWREVAAAGAWQRLRVPGAPVDIDSLSHRLPSRFRQLGRRYGVVTEADVDAVLDASGFAYGATWGDALLASTAREIVRLARRGRPYVFLPQAFGPFPATAAAREFGRALHSAALICARDLASRAHVEALAGGLGDRLVVAPDLTIGNSGTFPDLLVNKSGNVPEFPTSALLIPNVHMQDERSPDSAWRGGYLPLLAALGRRLTERGYTVRIVNHEGAADAALCASLREAMGGGDPVIEGADPRVLKALIGGARLVVSSRYHGCVNALGQAVPCLGTAWSHKYAALFEEFGVREFMLERCDPAAALATLDRLLANREATAARLAAARPALEAKIEAMWDRVIAILGGTKAR